MSIDWLLDLERAIENGKEVLGCPNVGSNQWVIGRPIEELRKIAKRNADYKKMAVDIVRVISVLDASPGDLFLVPTDIGDAGPRGEPSVRWRTVDTKEAAEMMRDLKRGAAPYFALQVVESIDSAEKL